MLRLRKVDIAQVVAERLQQYQVEIDDLPEYSERVALAKRLFSSRSSNSTFQEVRSCLREMCFGVQRCGYCEDSIGDEVEHIKPKDLYPEETFLWENYLLACGPCNGGKNNSFAIIRDNTLVDVTRKRRDSVDPPASGAPALINPRIERPEEYMEIELGETFFCLPLLGLGGIEAVRAEYTIDVLKLNRDILTRARRDAFGAYRARVVAYRARSEAGASDNELQHLRHEFCDAPHPSVWQEMKRKRAQFDWLDESLLQHPELEEL